MHDCGAGQQGKKDMDMDMDRPRLVSLILQTSKISAWSVKQTISSCFFYFILFAFVFLASHFQLHVCARCPIYQPQRALTTKNVPSYDVAQTFQNLCFFFWIFL